jgi:hypothetical protein
MEAKDTVMGLDAINKVVQTVKEGHILPLPHDYVQAGYDLAMQERLSSRQLYQMAHKIGYDLAVANLRASDVVKKLVEGSLKEQRQAGFDEGYNQAKSENIICIKVGRKEIIDWLNTENTLKWKSLKNKPDWFKHCGLGISDEKWQKQLKEWGIL